MNRITTLVPRKTDVQLGNRIFRVGEMRLLDLANLQGWLEDQWEDPLEALRGRLTHLQGKERRNTLGAIWEACEAGPPVWGTSRANKLFHTAEGIVQTFMAILGEHNPDLTREDIEDIAEETANHPDGWKQYQTMIRAWQPVDSIEELAFMLGMDSGPQGKPVTWVQAVCQTCDAMGWTIEYVMGLTMRQFKAIRSGGKPKQFGMPVQPKTNLKGIVAAMKKKLST